MNEPVRKVHDPVLAEGYLLPFATWMLHDRHEVPDDGLAFRFDKRVEAELVP